MHFATLVDCITRFRTTFLQLTTFLQFRLASSILPQSVYFFLWYFFLRCSIYGYEIFRVLLLPGENGSDDIHCYKMLLDLEGIGTVQCCIFC